jgi:hypothetical protein
VIWACPGLSSALSLDANLVDHPEYSAIAFLQEVSVSRDHLDQCQPSPRTDCPRPPESEINSSLMATAFRSAVLLRSINERPRLVLRLISFLNATIPWRKPFWLPNGAPTGCLSVSSTSHTRAFVFRRRPRLRRLLMAHPRTCFLGHAILNFLLNDLRTGGLSY